MGQELQALLDEQTRLEIEAAQLLELIAAAVEDLDRRSPSPTSQQGEPARYSPAA